MADVANRIGANVPGKWYTDSECIDCDLCRQGAPDNFTRDADNGYSYVYKQPENDDELASCEDVMDGCPVEAIGSDA